jgi:hypothetical protein
MRNPIREIERREEAKSREDKHTFSIIESMRRRIGGLPAAWGSRSLLCDDN